MWLFTVPYVIRALDRRPAQRARRVNASWRLVIAWSGMRGSVSLAVALALPLTTDAGGAFPQRDLIIFLTFAVIFFSLVGQGADPAGPDPPHRCERARTLTRRRSCTRGSWWRRRLSMRSSPSRTRAGHATRPSTECAGSTSTASAASRPARAKIDDDGYEDQSLAYQRTVQHVLAAQRDALLRLRTTATSRTRR